MSNTERPESDWHTEKGQDILGDLLEQVAARKHVTGKSLKTGRKPKKR